ncbi:MAG: LysM repeat protein [Planctomycetota bacterium]|jgi:LysM repeat protein
MYQSRRITMALVFLLIVTPCIHADVIPAGRKFLPVEIVLDLGTWVDQAWTSHVVVNGDSFSKIAKAHYGDATRAGEIAKANPKVLPKKMKLGTRLELPPKTTFIKKDGKKVPVSARRFYWWTDPMFGNGSPVLVENKAIAKGARYSAILISIPHKQKNAFEDAVKVEPKRGEGEPWKKIEGVIYSKSIGGRRTVAVGSAAKHIKIEVKLESINGKEMVISTNELNLDKHGKVVTWQQNAKLPLLAASGIGLLLFAGLYSRRRRSMDVPAE